ncbi:MAG TPA: long-chain fatty acid--CoA ligase [Methylomirabilota bacterium]|nr:long-chain fatty acid--CoA ligase [Methylomirabilota bacterium]
MADDTLARMFWNRVEQSRDRVAQEFKQGGTWRQLPWREYGQIVRELALGLLALGRRQGDAIAILSASRAEWVQADFAIFSAGCVTVPIYPSYTPEQIAYIISDAEAKTLIVENVDQLQKALQVRGKMEGLEQIVVMDGPSNDAGFILTWEELKRRGREAAPNLESLLKERVRSVGPDDVATIVYTSGTTGPPKGVVQTHGNHMAMIRAVRQVVDVTEQDKNLLFLPLAHSFARCDAFVAVYAGVTTAFAENLDKVGENLREVSPTYFASVPRVFEKVYAKVLAGVEAGSHAKKKIFYWALGVGRQVSQRQQRRQPIPFGLKLRYRLAHKLVFSKLHAAVGGRLQFANSGGAPLAKEIAEFFHAVDILIVEGYGLTETCPALTVNRRDQFKFGSVGKALPGVELRIAPDGEILARGPNIATRGYFKKPEATAEVFDQDGWFHTGDIGLIDADGFLFITDRKKDLIVTAGGMNIAPQNIENLLKTDPFISQALVYGDRRPYPVALITLNPEELQKFAIAQGLSSTDLGSLVRHPAIVQRVQAIVDARNGELQSYSRIKKFSILPNEFTQENGDLTPTLKLKRKIVVERQKAVLDSLYGA